MKIQFFKHIIEIENKKIVILWLISAIVLLGSISTTSVKIWERVTEKPISSSAKLMCGYYTLEVSHLSVLYDVESEYSEHEPYVYPINISGIIKFYDQDGILRSTANISTKLDYVESFGYKFDFVRIYLAIEDTYDFDIFFLYGLPPYTPVQFTLSRDSWLDQMSSISIFRGPINITFWAVFSICFILSINQTFIPKIKKYLGKKNSEYNRRKLKKMLGY
ncbi:MAG: hypothetical protein ACTSWY_14485 [Promethearchaeota archaeon]